MVSLKVGQYRTHSTSAVIAAINHAELKNIKILNYSGGNYGPYVDNLLLEHAIENYSGLFVCSAGNYRKNTDLEWHFPSNFNFPNLISVGASTEDDEIWIENEGEGSNFGQSTVDLFAPGHNIDTTVMNGDYDSVSGTSFAAPHVAGVAALIICHTTLTFLPHR